MFDIVLEKKQDLLNNFITFLENLDSQPYFIANDSWEFRYDIFVDSTQDKIVHLFDPIAVSKLPLFLSIIHGNDFQLKNKLFVHIDLIEKSIKQTDNYISKINLEHQHNNEDFTPLELYSHSLKLTDLFNYSFEDSKKSYEFYFLQLLKGIQNSNIENYMFFDSVELIRNNYFSQYDILDNQEYISFIKTATEFEKDVFFSYLFLAYAEQLIDSFQYSPEKIFDIFINYTNNYYTYQNMRLMDIYRVPYSLATVKYICKLSDDYILNYSYPDTFYSKEEFVESLLSVKEECIEKYNTAKNMENF